MNKQLEYQPKGLYYPLLESISKLLQDQTKVLGQAVGEWTEQLTKSTQERLDKFYREMGNLIQEMLDRVESDAGKVAPMLEQANFWLSSSMSLDLLRKLKAVVESEKATPEDVISAFIEYYEEDEWAELEEMVSSWQDNPYFASRMHIINDALEAHLNGKYTLVIPALLSQVEGIASSILGVPAGSSTGLVKSAITDQLGEFLHAASKDILIKFVTSPAGYAGVKDCHFTSEKFTKWLESKGVSESQSINRQGILHGVHVNYNSKENSLRVFLLLDMFYEMRRDEWDSQL